MYSWTSSDNEPWLLTRHLTALECMFVILNEKLYGQNCPFMGLSISVRSEEKSGGSLSFKLQHLQTGATKAFCQTRWKYPTIASRILDGNRASYNIESRSEVKSWANRALSIVHYDQGWQSFMERQSRDCSLPSPEGDVCALHLILPLENARGSELQSFDILIRIHHAFADGSGIRAILNEFLHRLTDPLSDEELRWGEEVSRLLPGASILGKVEVSEEETLVKAPDEMALSSKVFSSRVLHECYVHFELTHVSAVERRAPRLPTRHPFPKTRASRYRFRIPHLLKSRLPSNPQSCLSSAPREAYQRPPYCIVKSGIRSFSHRAKPGGYLPKRLVAGFA